MDENDLVFDMVGIDAPLANALRRILIAEVPTMCIENVYIQDNVSIIPDEVLGHRLGLVPIKVDPRQFDYKSGVDDSYTETNTIVFTLKMNCEAVPGTKPTDPDHVKWKDSRVLTSDLVWQPQGDQATKYPEGIRPVHEDILLAKLRPGQSMEFTAYCQKGIGKDHAKFSPVATASYRLLPEIVLAQEIKNEKAEQLVAMCPMNVFDIEDLGKGQKRAKVARPRDCTMCRECIRHPGWKDDKVKLRRVKNHYIFSVESTGVLPPAEIVDEGLKVWLEKIQMLKASFPQQQ